MQGMTEEGQIIDGKFRLERILGVGGMGVVYLATALDSERQVAVKLLRSAVIQSEEARIRLQREMEVMARLKSPYIGKLHSTGFLPDNSPYFAMEYLNGRDLRSELQLRGAIPIPEACAYIRQTCRGIAVAHALGIVHRDLKPHNLVVTSLDKVRQIKVVDFGIAKVLGETDSGITASDTVVGTPLYMCPEQLLSGSRTSTRSDVWSLGTILYELIAGVSPFADDSPGSVLAAITFDDPVPIQQLAPETPTEVAKLIHSALHKHPALRLPSVEDMARILLPYATPDELLTVASDSYPKAPPPPRPRPVRVRAAGLLRREIQTSVNRILIDDSQETEKFPKTSGVAHARSPDQLGLIPTIASLTEVRSHSDGPKLNGRASTGLDAQATVFASSPRRLFLVLLTLALPLAIGLSWAIMRFQQSAEASNLSASASAVSRPAHAPSAVASGERATIEATSIGQPRPTAIITPPIASPARTKGVRNPVPVKPVPERPVPERPVPAQPEPTTTPGPVASPRPSSTGAIPIHL